jgi:hypothetical protein
LFAFLFILWTIVPARGQALREDADTFFELRIRPILAGICFKCHGGNKVSHGLRVDSREALLKGGKSGPAIVPGNGEKSLLIQAIRRSHETIKMPPDKPLPEAAVADFTRWVEQGAAWPAKTETWTVAKEHHWAFEPIRPVAPPPDPSGWSNNAIDRFILAKLREQGLKPVASADKRTLIRRVYFDLIGLPPTPEQVADFLADNSPEAFAKVVDELLASPHYGERWGRHWMDVARYADTAGDNADYPIPEVHLYRDYIIDSFNADKPYDQFVQEQIAGDILAKQGPREKYGERLVATGFLALSRRYATGPYEFWHLTLEDSIETTGRAFLGLTLRCARCHDHKFDPISQQDYYAFYGIFASTQYPWPGAEEFASKKEPRQHFVALAPPAEAAPCLAAYQRQIHDLEAEIQHAEKEDPLARRVADLNRQMEAKSKQIKELEKSKSQPKSAAADSSPGSSASSLSEKPDGTALRTDLARLQKQRDQANGQLQAKLNPLRDRLWSLRRPGLPPDVPGAYAVQEGEPNDAYVQIRGEIDQHGPVAKRNVPQYLSGGKSLSIPKGTSGRLQLAEWLTSRENPLTARVMVNRIWQHHFGKGIAPTPSNFGLRGEPPTHPELLDWLANEFRGDPSPKRDRGAATGSEPRASASDTAWSIKRIHRLILLSKTYQLSTSSDQIDAANDPGNRCYWRFDRRRLDAESLRDSLLAVSGNLDLKHPGPQPFPPIEKWERWTQHNPFKEIYPTHHRSVFLMTQRFQRHPYLALFDGPDTNTTTDRRSDSTVPLQALFLMNDPFMSEQAEGFARRLITASRDVRQRIELAHQFAWSRPANPEEMERSLRYLKQYEDGLTHAAVSGDRRELETWTTYARILLSANEFVYLD